MTKNELSFVRIETMREHYSANDVKGTLTVGELIGFLSQYDSNLPVILSFDRGYTYGAITADRIEEEREAPEEEEEEE